MPTCTARTIQIRQPRDHHVKDVRTRHRKLLQPMYSTQSNWVAKPDPQKSRRRSRITATDHFA
ncbi:hypothetical protein E5345_11805 [Propionibacterium sp. NM47_B9-13]|nr:hypothetical protein CP877_05160 [Cutibacterium modestum]TGY27649.1 hypothetical protein E5345_11805 [Propionibacterium sp. NM47_B9-13]